MQFIIFQYQWAVNLVFILGAAVQGFHELLERDPLSKKNYFARPPKNHVNVPRKKVQTTWRVNESNPFCRKVIWFKPLFPLCQWVRWVQTWSASLGIPRPLKPPSDRTTSGFCRASAVFCFGTFFLGQLEKLHQILPGFRYIWKRERWMEVFFWRMRWTKMVEDFPQITQKCGKAKAAHFTVHTLPHGPSAYQERWSPRARKAWNDFKGSTMQAASLGFPSWRQSCWLFLSHAA